MSSKSILIFSDLYRFEVGSFFETQRSNRMSGTHGRPQAWARGGTCPPWKIPKNVFKNMLMLQS